jgi:hypothetical protein
MEESQLSTFNNSRSDITQDMNKFLTLKLKLDFNEDVQVRSESELEKLTKEKD